MRRNLTDRFIKSVKPAPTGERRDYADAIMPGLALRVTDRGHKSFVLVARYPLRPLNPTRRALGDYGALSLDGARTKAGEWLKLIAKGIDPRIEDARQKAAQQRRQANSWAAVVGDFLERHAKTLAKRGEAEAVLQRELGRRWNARPITDITPQEVSAAIRAIVARGAPYQAHNAFGWIRRLYSWAIGTGEYGVDASPVERLRPAELIGKREARDRVLSDAELRCAWEAAGDLAYPYGPLVRLLILTGQRVREVADMSWSEIDFDKALWTIPAERMKADRAHAVPLGPDSVALLKSLPRWTVGDFVFTTTEGAKPVNGFSKAKVRIDRLIAKARAAARAGKDAAPEKQDELADWVFHDLRRTMRTHLSALPVQDLVRELVIAHAKPGLHRVYDLHAYQDEKRHCLELWERRLKGIVEFKAPGIADIARARAARETARA